MVAEGSQRKRGLVGPFILIGLGILFLLNNLGWIDWSVWETILRLWPVVLIAVGLEVLIGRRSILGSLVVLVVVLAIIGSSIWLVGAWPSLPAATSAGWQIGHQDVFQPIDDAARGEVRIGINVGALKIRDLPESNGFVSGNIAVANGEQVEQSYRVNNGVAYFNLRSQEVKFFPFAERNGDRTWQLGFSRELPLRMDVNTGVGTADLDLTRLQVNDLNVKIGVGKTTVRLPAQGQTQANIDGGIGETIVTIPEGVAARIVTKAGIGEVNITGNYRLQNGVRTSPGYETAENRVDLDVKGGIGKITVLGN